jgi:hypothetical protein
LRDWCCRGRWCRGNRLAGANDNVPPAGIVFLIVPGDVRIAADGVANQDGIVARIVEPAVCLVGNCHAGQLVAQFQLQLVVKRGRLRIPQRFRVPHAVTAVKEFVAHDGLPFQPVG